MGLFILTFSHSLALSIVQAYVPYQTNYSYGEHGTIDLNAYIKRRLRADERVFATKDVLYRLGRPDEYLGHNVWSNKDTLLKTLRRGDVRFLILSIPSQSITTYQIIMSRDVQALLKDKRELGVAGSL